MAMVRELFETTAELQLHPTEVECGWRIGPVAEGKVIVQLSTYGSDFRKDAKRTSQTLQFDQKSGRELLAILNQAFPPA